MVNEWKTTKKIFKGASTSLQDSILTVHDFEVLSPELYVGIQDNGSTNRGNALPLTIFS